MVSVRRFAIVAGSLLIVGCGDCGDASGNGSNNSGSNNSTIAGTSGSNNETNAENNGTSGSSNNGTSSSNNGTSASNNRTGSQNQPFDPNETRAEYCAGEGPPVIVGDQGGETRGVCTGDLAAVTFRYALCVCSDLSTSGELRTDSFDSRQGPYDPNDPQPGGAVGVNGKLSGSKNMNVGGTCWVGGEEGISLSADLNVAYQLHDAGRLQGSKPISVAGDAWVVGDVNVSDLTVGGTLHLPNASTLATDNQVAVSRGPVDVPLPCDCEDLIDIGSFVTTNEQYNHNDDVGLDPDMLAPYNDPVTLDLECGRYYLSEIDGSDDVTINVSGRTAIFVGGDIKTSGSLDFNVAPGAELDLFVGGDIQLSKPLTLGDETQPSKARLYLAGENYSFSDDGVVAGNIYAPNAKVSASGSLEVYGSLFAGEISFSEALTIHYDTAILEAGESCSGSGSGSGGNNGMPNNGTNNGGTNNGGGGDGCSSCKDCNNQACNDGVCGECQISADCCSPLVCIEGQCVPYIL